MLQCFEGFLTQVEVRRLRRLAAEGAFADGRGSSGAEVREIKANEELQRSAAQSKVINAVIGQAVQRAEALRFFAWPKRMNTPLISRYRPGMAYGRHLDNPILTQTGGEPLRTDLSITVFLSEPDSYDGGALTLESAFGDQAIKLPAGDAVVYSTALLHQVSPVTRGERLAAVAWIQSMVRDAARRRILFDLYKLRRELAGPSLVRLDKCAMNLLKMWADV